MTGTQEIVWGPAIAVDGKRPGWLGDGDKIRWYWPSGATVDWTQGSDHVLAGKIGKDNWHAVGTIRLPADHPHYRQPAPIDWSGELEAVHEDGRVVPVTYEKPQGFKARHWVSGIAPEEQDEPVLFNSDGTHAYDSGWRIRNVTPQPTPQAHTKPDVTARMEALCRAMADVPRDSVLGQSGYASEACAIVALLPEPVDPDLTLAKELFDAAHPNNIAWEVPAIRDAWLRAARFVRGRELALAKETGK